MHNKKRSLTSSAIYPHIVWTFFFFSSYLPWRWLLIYCCGNDLSKSDVISSISLSTDKVSCYLHFLFDFFFTLRQSHVPELNSAICPLNVLSLSVSRSIVVHVVNQSTSLHLNCRGRLSDRSLFNT